MNFEIAVNVLSALGHETRLRIFHLLANAGNEGLPVGSLQSALKIPGATLSHHLARLSDVELISQERKGTTLVCKVEPETIDRLNSYLRRTVGSKAA